VLINHRAARHGPTVLSSTPLQQMVTITTTQGGEQRFLWIPSRQSVGACASGWLTDAVITLQTSERSNRIWPTRPLS
jgi:hypothetical protein